MIQHQTARGGWGQPEYEGLADTDGDDARDAIDNCTNVYNPQQLDANKNGVGDCCDLSPGCGQVACDTQCTP